MTDRPWTKGTTALVCLLGVGAAISLPWTVHPANPTGIDSAIYVRTSYALLDGAGYSYLGEPFALRPPGMSVLLAPVLAWFGTDTIAINTYVSLYGIVCVVLVFLYGRPWLGDLPAFAVALALWINPLFQRMCNAPMSEIPGTALMLGTLLADRWARRSPHPARNAAVGTLLAAATYVRSVSLLLLPAILVSRRLSRFPERTSIRSGVVVVAVGASLLAPWTVRNAIHRPEAPASHTRLYSQWTAMWRTDKGDPSSPLVSPASIAARVPEQLGSAVAALGHRLRQTDATRVHLGLGLIGLACLGAAAWRRRGAGEIFALGMLLPLSVWHGAPADRFVLPVFVLLLPATAGVLLDLVGPRLGAGTRERIVAGGVLLLAGLDSRAGVDWEAAERHHESRRRDAAELNERIPPGARVAGNRLWWWDSLYLDRPVYTVAYAYRRHGLRGARELMDELAIDTMIFRGHRAGELFAHLNERFRLDPLSDQLALFHRDPSLQPALE